MESNGVRGRIHVSQATADALINSGKGRWLENRQDKVEAKGKGIMQTYFVNVAAAKSVISTSSFESGSGSDSDDAAPTSSRQRRSGQMNDLLPFDSEHKSEASIPEQAPGGDNNNNASADAAV